MSFATIRVVGGLVFSLGLAIVLVGGAELFTGDNLIVMAWASGRISTLEVLRNWVIVYCGNFVGGAGLAVLRSLLTPSRHERRPYCADDVEYGGSQISPDVATLFFKGILCNLLVCFAVWLAAAGDVCDRQNYRLILPISAFVAAGFEHSVANMYFLPMAWLLVVHGNVPPGFDASLITISGIIHNLVPVTLGNIVGGAGFVALRSIGDLSQRPGREIR